MKKKNNNNLKEEQEVNQYIKKGFIRNLPFGFKATFIKYWFYGALYFFCFMGLGLTGIKNENLVLATGLIGGALFDIAVYNIFLLFADTREEASKWWFFKSKKVYSILINVVIITGLFFAFYYIVVPIRKYSGQSWLFGEPLTSALLLVTLDSALVWLKNLIVILMKKLFKLGDENKNKQVFKILEITPVSITIEMNNLDPYYTKKAYNVLLDNQIVLRKINKNVITIYDLKPDCEYKIQIHKQNTSFRTPKVYKVYKVYEGNDIQDVIDYADQYSLIIVNKGTYEIKSLLLKNNLILYLRKDSILIVSGNIDEYQVIPEFNSSNQNEVYGNYLGKSSLMRQSIIHLDHLNNVKIVGEGVIDRKSLLDEYKKKKEDKIAPPNIIFINHSSDISIIGLTLKNSPQECINPFFSNNINLFNLNIINEKNEVKYDGITPRCSSLINIVGCSFANIKSGIAIKSCQKELLNLFHISCKDISVRNNIISHAYSGISLGIECASTINNINIFNSYIMDSNVGILIKSNIKMGKESIIRDINIENVNINNIFTPVVMDMHEESDNESLIKIDDMPRFKNFIFKNIIVSNYSSCAGYFYGLDKRYIDDIKIVNSTFNAGSNTNLVSSNLKDECFTYNKFGFMVKNVKFFRLEKVNVIGLNGKKINSENVGDISDL